MKNIAIILLLIVGTLSTKVYGQYVTIPDSNFVIFLQNFYPNCMQGNQMDTTCYEVVTSTSITCVSKNIADISGIEYFDELTFLWCSDNIITHIGKLPPKLEILRAVTNNISYLTAIPSSLRELDISSNNLSSFPTLPDSLEILIFNQNYFTTLPPIPPYLQDLRFGESSIDSLPPLPATLTYLNCSFNYLDSLPTLPPAMYFLNMMGNSITILPNLPNTLKVLRCASNLLDSLPALPQSLRQLSCNFNNLSSIPALPDSLWHLTCSRNNLTSLPILPSRLTYLNCGHNNITDLQEFPSDSMYSIIISYNPISCMPQLKKVGDLWFLNTNINCLPNYGEVATSNPPLASLPLCEPNNANGCQAYYNLSGKVFIDANSNCVKDNIDTVVASVKIQLWENGQLLQQVFTGGEGLYSFDVQNTYGTYLTSIDSTHLPFTISCPDTGYYTSVLSPTDSIFINQDFAVDCRTAFDVGVHDIVRSSGWFRPGSTHSVKFIAGDLSQLYGASCAAIPGQVMVVMDGPASIVGFPSIIPTYTNGDTAIWDVVDFSAITITRSFSFDIEIDTTAQVCNAVCFNVFVSPTAGDVNTANNHFGTCYYVVSSYDPNDKEVYPFNYIDTTQEWLFYTVNFQNTGNAPALNITVLDTLSNYLDWGSMQMLSHSHDNYTQVMQGGIVKFNFPNINLPDSTSDEPGSHGFVRYKIKLKDNLPLGTVIENTAHIYFDFNAPIVTNTTMNTIMLPLAQPMVAANSFNACDEDTLTLETVANPAFTYQWFVNGSRIINSNTANLQVMQSGIYSVRVSDSSLLATSDQQLVTFNNLPVVALTFPSNPFCKGTQPVDISTYGSPTGGVYSGLAVLGSNIDVSTTGSYKVIYTFTDNNDCSDSKETIAIVDECIGVPEIETLGITVYPNPNNGSFTLTLDALNISEVEFKLTNALGEVVDQRTFQIQTGTQSIYISNERFATGIYFIQLQTEKGTYFKQMVIK